MYIVLRLLKKKKTLGMVSRQTPLSRRWYYGCCTLAAAGAREDIRRLSVASNDLTGRGTLTLEALLLSLVLLLPMVYVAVL